MLRNKEGRVMRSEDFQRLRDKVTAAEGTANMNRYLSARALQLACKANKALDSNFLLTGDRCCYCGVRRLVHKVVA